MPAVAVGGVGVAGVVVGTVFGLRATSQWDEAQSYCTGPEATHCTNEAAVLSSDATFTANVSTTGFVVGGAAIGTAVVLWLTAPSDSEPAESSIHLSPMASGNAWGAIVSGTWQ